MDVVRINQAVDEIAGGAAAPGSGGDHRALFSLYRSISDRLRTDGADIDGLIDAQTVVLRTAAALPALTAEALLYKLALWRWDAPDLSPDLDDMTPFDAVAYAAFRDLAAMLGAADVFTEQDRAAA